MGGRIIKIVNTSAIHLLLKRGGLTFEGGVFSGEYGTCIYSIACMGSSLFQYMYCVHACIQLL